MNNILKSTILKYKGAFFLFIFFNICISAISLISPYLIGAYIDILTTKISEKSIYIFLIIYILLNFSNVIFSYIQNMISLKLKAKMSFEIINKLVEHLNDIPLKLLQKYDPVYMSQRISSDSNNITEFIISEIYKITISIINFIVISLFLIKLDYTLFFVLAISIVLYIIFYLIFKNKINKRSLQYFNSQNLYSSALNEPFKFCKTVKINSVQEIFSLRMSNVFQSFLESLHKYGKISYIYSGLKDSSEAIFTAMLLCICGLKVLNKAMTVGEITIIINYFSMTMGSLGYILGFGKVYEEYKVCLSRLRELISIDKEKYGSKKLDVIDEVSLKNIVYSECSDVIINNFSYSFKKGNIYTLLGNNGCGKSTLLYIITRVISNNEGNIYFNKINEKDINAKYLRKKNIAFLEQEPVLINDTFYNNMINNSVEDKLLNYYIDLFDLQKCFDKFENGIHTVLSENSDNISGGEKQKIGLVRTLIKDTDIIILDEPTSALDKKSTENLKIYLNAVKKNKIIIIVTHDNTMIDISDFVLNFDECIVDSKTT